MNLEMKAKIYIYLLLNRYDDIIDLEYFEFIKDDKAPPKGIYPFIFCRAKEPLTNINKVINYVKTNIKKDPYEIKIFPLYVENENKDILTLFMKFYSFEDAKIIAESLKNAYGNPVRVCFDKREIKDSKWYCVVFRMEGGGDQKLGKFVQLMDDIFKEIPGDEKKFLMNSFEGTCEGQINGVKCIRKLGEVFYCMIKVESIDQAALKKMQFTKMKLLINCSLREGCFPKNIKGIKVIKVLKNMKNYSFVTKYLLIIIFIFNFIFFRLLLKKKILIKQL